MSGTTEHDPLGWFHVIGGNDSDRGIDRYGTGTRKRHLIKMERTDALQESTADGRNGIIQSGRGSLCLLPGELGRPALNEVARGHACVVLFPVSECHHTGGRSRLSSF